MASLTSTRPSKDKTTNNVGVIKCFLKVGGTDLDGNGTTLYRIYSTFVIIFILILYPILDFLELFKHESTVVAENIFAYFFSFSLAAIKATVLFLKRKKFGKLLHKLEHEPFTLNTRRGGDEEEEIIRECVWFTTMQTRAYYVMTVASIVGANGATLFNRLRSNDYRDWIFPYGPLTVLNITYSPNYEISWIYQGVSSTYLGFQFVSVDLATVYVLANISYQFKMVQGNLRRVVLISRQKMLKENGLLNLNSANEPDSSVIQWKYLKSSLKEAVDYHLAVINLVEEMESVFSGLLLTVFLSILGIICFMVYRVSLVSSGDPKVLNAVAEPLVGCFQVALLCYWGEQVVYESQQVGNAAFASDFADTDVRFWKSLILIIRRSQNPSKLTAGKFSVVGLATFVWVMRTSYSAFMMLRNTHV